MDVGVGGNVDEPLRYSQHEVQLVPRVPALVYMQVPTTGTDRDSERNREGDRDRKSS